MTTEASQLDTLISSLTELKGSIATFRTQLGKLPKELRSTVAGELRKLAGELVDEENLNLEVEAKTTPLSKRPVLSQDRNLRERMIRFFRSTHNAPATSNEIMKATTATKGAVNTILYRDSRNNGAFEKDGHAVEGTAAAPWHLTAKGLKESESLISNEQPSGVGKRSTGKLKIKQDSWTGYAAQALLELGEASMDEIINYLQQKGLDGGKPRQEINTSVYARMWAKKKLFRIGNGRYSLLTRDFELVEGRGKDAGKM
jgi:hypothetical protein